MQKLIGVEGMPATGGVTGSTKSVLAGTHKQKQFFIVVRAGKLCGAALASHSYSFYLC
jgi:hypothetical protein